MNRLVLFLSLCVSSTAGAIVIRHDVDDTKYRIDAAEFPALADLPGEGHGVLIAPQWVVTAAHATFTNPTGIMLNGVCREVERIIIHPGYKKLPDDLIAETLKSGVQTRAIALLTTSDDIALIKLAQPVTDVAPTPLYRHNDELGKTVKLIGKGATGNGLIGQNSHDSHRTALRRAYSKISRTDGHWLVYRFERGPAAHALEGVSANGDSGGPVLIEVKGRWQLAGLASWKYIQPGKPATQVGFYGQSTYNVRLSSYAKWIEDTMAAEIGNVPSGSGKTG